MKNANNELILTGAVLKALEPLTGNDERRPAMQCIHLQGSSLQVTDGHSLLTVPVNVKLLNEDSEAFIPSNLVKMIPSKDEISDMNSCHLWSKGNKFSLGSQPGTWPNTEQVIPKEKAKFRIGMSSGVLKQVMTALEKLSKLHSRPDDMVVFSFTDAKSAIKLELNGTDISGLIMPCRIDD